MRTKLSVLIAASLVLLLASSSAQAQSFGPAKWIRQSWAPSTFIPLDIAVGPGEEVFVTGQLAYETDAWFETAPSDSSASGTADILALEAPPNGRGFFVGYDGVDGAVRFVRSGSVLSLDDYGYIGRQTTHFGSGYSVAVVHDRVYHGEGPDPLRPNEHGAAMMTVRNLQGELQQRFGPLGAEVPWRSFYIHGTGFDAHGNIYMAGTYRDTLYFSPEVVLSPSRTIGEHHLYHTWDVFVASYGRDGKVRWAHHIEDPGLWSMLIAFGWYGKAAFDVNAEGNVMLGAVFNRQPPGAFSVAEDGVVLASYASNGTLVQVQTNEGLGISYEPPYSALQSWFGPFAGEYAAYPAHVGRDGRGNLYVLWSKRGNRTLAGTNLLTVSGTTFYSQEDLSVRVLTRFDPQGSLSWARQFKYEQGLYPIGMQVTE